MAGAALACIAFSTIVSIVAGDGVCGVGAADTRCTTVIRAWISVITGDSRRTGLAVSVCTGIAKAAGIVVVAWKRVVREETSRGWVTPVVGASLSVVAYNGLFTLTDALRAHISLGACVRIVAFRGVGSIHASCLATAIVGAQVSIVAVDRHTGCAATVEAVVA